MPASVEDLVWYVMCFTITTGFPTIIVIALNIQKLLHDVVVKQAIQTQWIEAHDKVHESLNKAIEKLG